MLTVFSDVWSNKKKEPKSPQQKPSTLMLQQNDTIIFNLALSNVQMSVLEMLAN